MNKSNLNWAVLGTGIIANETAKALYYEMFDMENAVLSENEEEMKLELSKDVMDIMTKLRESWGLKYPEEM